MWFRKETIKYRNSALATGSADDIQEWVLGQTCKRFSKSWAANFLSSETFVEKRRIVSAPNDATSR